MPESLQLDESDLGGLRQRLLQMGPDYEAATDVIQAFMGGLGYGISHASARLVAENFGRSGGTVAAMRALLSNAAWVA